MIVYLPSSIDVPEGDAFVEKQGQQIVITPVTKTKKTWQEVFDALDKVSDDFMADGRNQPRIDEEPDEPPLFD